MDTTAKLFGVRLSPQKGRLVADLIRGKTVENALNILGFSPKKRRGDHSQSAGVGNCQCRTQ